MPYSDFTLPKVKQDLGLTIAEDRNLFAGTAPVEASNLLKQLLEYYQPLAVAINSEKARSEFLIAPILAELKRQTNNRISLFSGTDFNVDQSKGLVGFCDFIISGSSEQFYVNAPVITIVEAKKENIVGGLGQCIASMLAAQIFNEQTNNSVKNVYGVVTSGTNWKFIALEDTTAHIDLADYYISQLDVILGILLELVS